MADPVNNPETLTLWQYAGIAGAFIGTSIAAFFGMKSKLGRSTEAEPPPSRAGIEMFFDGPIGKALGLLEGIYREQMRVREDAQRYANENNKKLDEMIGLLRDIKDRMRDLRSSRSPRRD